MTNRQRHIIFAGLSTVLLAIAVSLTWKEWRSDDIRLDRRMKELARWGLFRELEELHQQGGEILKRLREDGVLLKPPYDKL